MATKIYFFLESMSRNIWLLTSLVIVVIVAMLDFVTGPEIAFSLFYLIPVSLLAWFTGLKQGVLISFLSALVWFYVDHLTGRQYSSF